MNLEASVICRHPAHHDIFGHFNTRRFGRGLANRAPSHTPAVIIGIEPMPTIQREFSAAICNDAGGIYPIVTRRQSPRVSVTVILNPCFKDACMICPCLGACEEKCRPLLRKNRGRANEKMTHNERSHHDKNFHARSPADLHPDLKNQALQRNIGR